MSIGFSRMSSWRPFDNRLFMKNPSSQPLSWGNRMKIALDAAKGLAFLHSDEVNVIFRDFKSSSIFLSSNNDAKLYGLGLARNGPTGGEEHVFTRVMGTTGYVAPEYAASGCLTAKCDVYAFGAVLFEIITSRRMKDVIHSAGKTSVMDWAIMKGEYLSIMDVEIEGQYSISGAEKAANLALQCISTDPNHRPNMPQVVAALEQLQTENMEASEWVHPPVQIRQ